MKYLPCMVIVMMMFCWFLGQCVFLCYDYDVYRHGFSLMFMKGITCFKCMSGLVGTEIPQFSLSLTNISSTSGTNKGKAKV